MNDTINELTLNINQTTQSACHFNNCLIQTTDTATIKSKVSCLNIIFNKNPKFKNPSDFNFEIDSLSAAIQAGDISTGQQYPYDLNNVSRTTNPAPDIGAYQWVKK
jgi:hypothetical protein